MGQGRRRRDRPHRVSAQRRRLAIRPPFAPPALRVTFFGIRFVLTKAPRQSNTMLLSHIDCPGGGQVWVEGTTLYVGHMRPTSGTTIFDIADPQAPRVLATIPVREGWHSHKVRVSGGIMVVNQEKFGKSSPGD